MKKIGVLVNSLKPAAAAVLARLGRRAATLGLELYLTDEATAALLPAAQRVTAEELPARVELLLALGGDGTLLRAARALQGADCPVLGVNLGSLGFMTSVTEDELETALTVIAEDRFSTWVRTVMDCRLLRDGRPRCSARALNDAVIGWGASSRVVTLEVSIDEDPVASYVCDGLIVSTPTGSTGHSLSAGGPILHPHTPAWLINAICPHTLSTRPLIVPDDSRIRVRLAETAKTLLFSVDGQENYDLEQGDVLEIRRSPQGVRFVHLPGYSYFSLLRQKLHWRGSSV